MIAQTSLVLVRLATSFASVGTGFWSVCFAVWLACSVIVETAGGGVGFAAFVAGVGAGFLVGEVEGVLVGVVLVGFSK